VSGSNPFELAPLFVTANFYVELIYKILSCSGLFRKVAVLRVMIVSA
jgi:hypothetical protein